MFTGPKSHRGSTQSVRCVESSSRDVGCNQGVNLGGPTGLGGRWKAPEVVIVTQGMLLLCDTVMPSSVCMVVLAVGAHPAPEIREKGSSTTNSCIVSFWESQKL